MRIRYDCAAQLSSVAGSHVALVGTPLIADRDGVVATLQGHCGADAGHQRHPGMAAGDQAPVPAVLPPASDEPSAANEHGAPAVPCIR